MSKSTDRTAAYVLSSAALAKIDAIVERYPNRASALMPCLWVVMDEAGWVPPGAIAFLVERLEVTAARVHEVLTFYTMYRTEPQAEHVLQVCRNISCHVMGARPVIAHLEKELGVRMGQATADGKFALEGAECLGACGMGPCMQLGRHLYENLTPGKVDAILASLRSGIVPRADTDREGVD